MKKAPPLIRGGAFAYRMLSTGEGAPSPGSLGVGQRAACAARRVEVEDTHYVSKRVGSGRFCRFGTVQRCVVRGMPTSSPVLGECGEINPKKPTRSGRCGPPGKSPAR